MKFRWIALFSAITLFGAACGESIEPAKPCTVQKLDSGDLQVTCGDGSQGTVHTAPEDPQTCTIRDNDDGTHSVTCGEESIDVGYDCADGFPGDLYVGSGAPGGVLLDITGCTSVQGDLYVGGMSSEGEDIPNGESAPPLPDILQAITSIDGSLIISSTAQSEVSLPNITHVGGDIDVQYNQRLTAAPDLSGLQTIGGSILINWNDALANLDGLPTGFTVKSVQIRGNMALPQCEAEAYGESLTITGDDTADIEANFTGNGNDDCSN